MNINNSDYFDKLLGISTDEQSKELSIKDEVFEQNLELANLQKNVKKSNIYTFCIFLLNLIYLYINIVRQSELQIGFYFVIAGIIFDLVSAKITCYLYDNPRFRKISDFSFFI